MYEIKAVSAESSYLLSSFIQTYASKENFFMQFDTLAKDFTIYFQRDVLHNLESFKQYKKCEKKKTHGGFSLQFY